MSISGMYRFTEWAINAYELNYSALTHEKILPALPVPVGSVSWNICQNVGTFPPDGAGCDNVAVVHSIFLQSHPTTSEGDPLRFSGHL